MSGTAVIALILTALVITVVFSAAGVLVALLLAGAGMTAASTLPLLAESLASPKEA